MEKLNQYLWESLEKWAIFLNSSNVQKYEKLELISIMLCINNEIANF